MSVPEAPVNEDSRPIGSHHDIWASRNAFHVETVAVPVTPQPTTNKQLGLRVLAVDMRHTAVPLVGSHRIGHGIFNIGLRMESHIPIKKIYFFVFTLMSCINNSFPLVVNEQYVPNVLVVKCITSYPNN